VNLQPIAKVEELAAAVAKLKASDVVNLRIRRGGQASFVSVRIGGKK
jgi:S1-C subfamily serine protease